MVKHSLITKMQAQTLKELGFKEPTSCYFWSAFIKPIMTNVDDTDIVSGAPDNSNNIKHCVSVPTVDEVIDWLRRKYNIVIYDKIEPFVDPTDDTHKTILFRFGVKQCDTKHLGWNGRVNIGETRLSKNVYSLKREAVNIALKYILKSYGEHTKSTESPSF